jgi:serine/threonine-protein kinase
MSSFGATVFAGRYRVIRRLGAGGTAAVFLTRDERLGREVALKRLHGAEVTAQTAQRLQREARIMASLRHPNLVPVYDMLMDEDDLLLVMEYVRGETLADVLTSAPLDWERTLELLEPVAAALDHVHDRGVVHRDLKPSNILVGTAGVVKVADLGLATAAEITRITPPGAILGTPAYMAPEQARAGPCTAAVDVYAFASIAFQALSGTLPRPGSTVVAVLRQALEPPPDLRARRPTAPAAAAEALMRGMSPKPEERQRSASQLLEELAAAFGAGAVRDAAAHAPDGQLPSRARRERLSRPVPLPPPKPRRERNLRARLLAIGALAAGVTAVLVFVAGLQNDRTSRPERPPPAREPALTAIPSATATPARTATPAAPRALSATATVRAFYRRAAAGHYAAAWRLAAPGMRAAFGNSFERFRSDLSSLRRIEFQQVAITERDDASVTVEIQSVATHDDRVDRCSGTLRTVRGNRGDWVVEPAGVRCASE